MECTYKVTYIAEDFEQKTVIVNNCISYLDAEQYIEGSLNVSVVNVEYIGEYK